MAIKSEKCAGLLKEIFYQKVKDNLTFKLTDQVMPWNSNKDQSWSVAD